MTKRFLLMILVATALSVGTARAADHADKPVAAVPGGGGHDAAAGGHVQHLPLVPDPTSREVQLQALWVVILFLVLLAILYPTAWKSVLAGLKAREQRIRKDIADAEAARAKAEETLKQYTAQLQAAEEKVRDMIGRATAEGEKIASSIKTRAQSESEEIKERAQRDIEASRDQAVAEIYQQAATLATTVAGKILHKTLNADDHRDLVNRSLDQLQATGRN